MTNTENAHQTASITGATHIPTCPYCNLLLTSNEYDFETSGWYSAHTGCVHESAAGRFTIDTLNKVTNEVQRRDYGYTTHRRAYEQMMDLARNNRDDVYKFQVRDRISNAVTAVSSGKLDGSRYANYRPDLVR